MNLDRLLGRSFSLSMWKTEWIKGTPELITITGVNPLTPDVIFFEVYRHATGTHEALSAAIFAELVDAGDVKEAYSGPANA